MLKCVIWVVKEIELGAAGPGILTANSDFPIKSRPIAADELAPVGTLQFPAFLATLLMPKPASHRGRVTRRRRTASSLVALAAVAAALHGASPAHAQQLMVGADGAVHLDSLHGVDTSPVVIEQPPTIIPAQGPVVQTPTVAGQIPYNSVQYGVPCVTGVPMAQPMYAQVVQQQQQPKQNLCSVFGEFLFLHPTGADVTHAQQQNGLGGPGTVPFGQIGVTDFTYEPTWRVGGSWWLSDCTSIVGSYTSFNASATDRVDLPALPGGGGTVGSFVTHPGAALDASIGPLNANAGLEFQLADGEYNAQLVEYECYALYGSVGLRYAHLEQDFAQQGEFAGGFGGTIGTNADVSFDGGGMKLGLSGHRELGNTRISIYGRSSVSPLVGQFSSHYAMRNTTGDILLAQADWRDDRVMTLLDYELGLSWTGPRGHLRLAAGYMASHWFNAVTTSSYINAVQTGSYLDVSDTISFDGPVAHAEVLW